LKKINVAVIMGGPSVEREVSMNSGMQVLKNLNPLKYDAFPVEITKDGGWLIGHEKTPLAMPWTMNAMLEAPQPLAMMKAETPKMPAHEALKKAHNLLKTADIAYLALHGAVGEDGSLQGLLETINFPYTGSGVMASSLAMDKIRAKQIFAQFGLNTARSLVYHDFDFEKNYQNVLGEIKNWIGVPCVVKPPLLGSSVGVTLCRTEGELKEALEKCFYFGTQALIEEFIDGVEVTCGVLEQTKGRGPMALPVTEISCPKNTFFDYKVKYTKGAAEEITPARLSKELTKAVQKTALTVHQAMGCQGMSRTDMILRGETIFVLETNTLPGMTMTSLLPQGAAAAGITYSELLDTIIETGLEKHELKKKYLERI